MALFILRPRHCDFISFCRIRMGYVTCMGQNGGPGRDGITNALIKDRRAIAYLGINRIVVKRWPRRQ